MRLLSLWLGCGLLLGLPWSAAAAPVAEVQDTRGWLSRIHQAAELNNFQGTFVVSGGGSVSSARISHFGVGGHQYEHIESLDGPARHVFRHNDWVHTLWPQTRVVQIEQRSVQGTFPGLLQVADARFADHYQIKRQQDERVAGFAADVLTLQPRDNQRFGYRLWAEKQSGLLLRADVLSERGEVLETSVFSELTIGVKPQPDSILRPMKKLDGYSVTRPSMQATQLDVEGWALRNMVPGFQPVSCVKRPLDVHPLPAVIQAVFSDGLTYVSVFIEPFSEGRHGQPRQISMGATHTLARRNADVWITAVGDVPLITLRSFLDGLERVKP
jgi:sigma-E factor negative regulatory protein RseB